MKNLLPSQTKMGARVVFLEGCFMFHERMGIDKGTEGIITSVLPDLPNDPYPAVIVDLPNMGEVRVSTRLLGLAS